MLGCFCETRHSLFGRGGGFGRSRVEGALLGPSLAACGSLLQSPLRLSLAAARDLQGRPGWRMCCGACLLFLCRSGGVLARACGLISPGVSAFNNLGVLLLLRVARGFPRFRGVPGRCWDRTPGEAAGAPPQAGEPRPDRPLPCSTLRRPSPVLLVALPASPPCPGRRLPALFSLGRGIMS